MSDDRPAATFPPLPKPLPAPPPPPKNPGAIVQASEDGSQQPTLLRGEWVRDVFMRGEYVVLEKGAGGGVMLDEPAVRMAALAFALNVRTPEGRR